MHDSSNEYDDLIVAIADYVHRNIFVSDEIFETAAACLADALGCASAALKFPECRKLLGPLVPEISNLRGCRVPGTSYILDPVTAAFNIGTMIRWLDFNDTWLAAEWGHPSDNLGGLLAVMDYLAQFRQSDLTVKDLLYAMIQAYEIQGIMAIDNSFNKVGFDHVILVKIATAAVVTKLLGGTFEQICSVVSQSFIDVGPLRTYRHAPDTGPRKSWAAGDATSRGVFLSFLTLRGEPGYLHALTSPKWGLSDVLFGGKPLSLARDLDAYVMEHILFKVAYPAEFHAQTAVECAISIYPQIKDKWKDIESIEVETQSAAMRIIDKKGSLNNPADRDHCLQYIVAVALLYGELRSEFYEDAFAEKDERIDKLREIISVRERVSYSVEYLDPEKRSIGNALTIRFKNGTSMGPIEVLYPLGHKRRRDECKPFLQQKLYTNLLTCFNPDQTKQILELFNDIKKLKSMKFADFISYFIK